MREVHDIPRPRKTPNRSPNIKRQGKRGTGRPRGAARRPRAKGEAYKANEEKHLVSARAGCEAYGVKT